MTASTRRPNRDKHGDQRDASSTSSAVQERRRHGRNAAYGPGNLVSRLGRTSCQLLDLSYCGARITCPEGIIPSHGELVRLSFVDGTSVVGQVVWIGPNEIGIHFSALVPDIHERPDGTHLGKAYFTRLVDRQCDR